MEAIDCSTVASVGEPTLTRYGVWMNDGIAALGAALDEQRVLRRVARGQLPAARVADEDLDGARADGVGVGEPALGQAALDLDLRTDQRRGGVQDRTATEPPGS